LDVDLLAAKAGKAGFLRDPKPIPPLEGEVTGEPQFRHWNYSKYNTAAIHCFLGKQQQRDFGNQEHPWLSVAQTQES
jgi:hypothetical protein